MRIWCGRNLMSANCSQTFGTGRRKRKGLRRTKSASSAGGERRHRPRGQSFCGRRDCADAAQARCRGRGRYSAPVHAPACADGCAGLHRAQRRCAEWRRDVPRQRASCNRGLHRPQSGTDRCEKPRTAKRPPPKAIFRLSSGADATRGALFAREYRWADAARRFGHGNQNGETNLRLWCGRNLTKDYMQILHKLNRNTSSPTLKV